jgi:glucose 1-dehydrogenase
MDGTPSTVRLDGRVALVTGGAQGIGAGICTELVGAGANLAIVDLQVDKARELAERLQTGERRVIAVGADIASLEGCQEAVSQVAAELGGIDILINNAAPGRSANTIGVLTGANWPVHEQVVLQAAVNLTEAALPHLSARGRGAVVNISSVTGTTIAIDQCSWSYHVSKAGLNHLTRWLASRLGPQGVRVNAVAPGLIDRDAGPKAAERPMHRELVGSVVPLRRAGRAADVANAVIFLCSDQSAYITGQVLVVDGGLELDEVWGAAIRVYQLAQTPAKTGPDR